MRPSPFRSNARRRRRWIITGSGFRRAAIPQAQQCGWLKDKFGLAWQVVPKVLPRLLTDPNTAKSQRAFQAMMQMKKLDIKRLQRAFDG
jgi:predicted 3-demethylubiquinone-9 3-methyltransferase (glyoxalase superfamily)